MIGTMKEIRRTLGLSPHHGDVDISIAGVSTDTRTIGPGDLFVALKGESFDGHDFVKAAFDHGAVAAVVENDYLSSEVMEGKLLRVGSSLKAYGLIARMYRRKCAFTVVAITGSSGKTTTKDMVAEVLSERYRVVKTQKNYNNEVGLPLTILSAPEETEVLVLEMGMRAKGEIAYLAGIAEPDMGIITNIGVAHIGELGSQENILKAKGELLEGLKMDGIGIFSGEDGFEKELEKLCRGSILKVGFGDNCDIRGRITEEQEGMTSVHLSVNGKEEMIHLPYQGRHLIQDSLLAIACGSLLGISVKKAEEALNHLMISPGRLSVKDWKSVRLIDDTYNANPESMKASIDVLSGYSGRKIAVLGDMRELGPMEKRFHLEIGPYLFFKKIDILITVGFLGSLIGEGFKVAGGELRQVYSCTDTKEAADVLKKLLERGDTVLFKASRAMGLEDVIERIEGITDEI